MAEAKRLYGMKALVTSAAGGIGEAVARTLAKHGATVLAVDGVNTGIEQKYSAVRGVKGYAADLGDAGKVAALVDAAAEKLGTIDIVVNDFPLRADGTLVSAKEWREQFPAIPGVA